jgi:hypothetical protein
VKCMVHNWDLSWHTLTVHTSTDKLNEIEETDHQCYVQIKGADVSLPSETSSQPEDKENDQGDFEDDCDVPIEKAVQAIMDDVVPQGGRLSMDANGNLWTVAEAESVVEPDEVDKLGRSSDGAERRPKRQRRQLTQYGDVDFIRWASDDDDDGATMRQVKNMGEKRGRKTSAC